jgi:3-hydroxyisobutyryl-CoA hydrolase
VTSYYSEHGFATHFIPSRRVAILLDRIKALETPSFEIIDRTIEELSSEREPDELSSPLVGDIRVALDSAFRHESVELILKDLEEFSKRSDAAVSEWAKRTLDTLRMRSPTSLKVALKAIRRGKSLSLLETLQMELGIATAYCVSLFGPSPLIQLTNIVQNGASPDFETGVTAVLIDRSLPNERPSWSPATVEEVSPEIVARFFDKGSLYLTNTPDLSVPDNLPRKTRDPMRFALPTEVAIARRFRDGKSGIIALPDLLAHFGGVDVLRPGKQGAREKVLEVLQRRCKFVDKDDGRRRHWIRWVQ